MSNGLLEIGTGCQGVIWNNPNITISTGILNVLQATTISVQVHNTGADPVRLNGVQVNVCAVNTMHAFDASTILPSLRISNGLSFDNVAPFPTDIVIPGGSSSIVSLDWTPQPSDIHSFDNVAGALFENLQKTGLHVCIFANCFGSFPPVVSGQVTDDGQTFTWNQINNNFCADTHHGQRNTSLHRLTGQRSLSVPFFAGVAGDRATTANVAVTEFQQGIAVDRSILEDIKHAGLDGVSAHPAATPAKHAGLARFRGPLAHVEGAVEEVLEELKEGAARLLGKKPVEDDDQRGKPALELELKGSEPYPLLLELEFDEHERIGAVHVFDVVQTNLDGTLGGFRFVTVNAP